MVSDLTPIRVGSTPGPCGITLGGGAWRRCERELQCAAHPGRSERLSHRLSVYPGALVVAEPTAMSWLALGHAVADAGCGFTLVEARHTARLREAIAGKNKTDVIDADMLAWSVELFGLSEGTLPTAAAEVVAKAVRRRHRLVAEAHNGDVRLWAMANWVFPDTWKAMKESHRLARVVLTHWPRIDRLGRAISRRLKPSVEPICVTEATHSDGRNGSETLPGVGPGSGPAGSTSKRWRGRPLPCSTTSRSPTARSTRQPGIPPSCGERHTAKTNCWSRCRGSGRSPPR